MAKKETPQQLAFERAYLKKHPKKMTAADKKDPAMHSGFNPYAAGSKHYGGGRSAPTHGKVDPIGYAQRDAKAKARKAAIAKRLAAMQGK